MKRKLLIPILLTCLSLGADPSKPPEPRYTSDGQLLRPDDYREWIYLTSGLGMTYGFVDPSASPASLFFDNVFVTPAAYRAFLKTGTWPDKTMFALEVRSATTKGSINKGGHYQEGIAGLEVHLKDESRYATRWAFFGFDGSGKSAKPLPLTSSCQTCHSRHGVVDETFVQFYPTLLPVAQAHGTLKAETEK